MRDLSKTNVLTQFRSDNGRILMQIRVSDRGNTYTCFMVGLPGTDRYYPRDLRDMRLSQLQEAAQLIGTLLTEGKIKQEPAETVLDLIYAHLNTRLTKSKKE